MTEQPKTPDIDELNDPLVSSAYRESASERAPDMLNYSVMQQAREQLRKGFFRPVVWLRPMAWAATIGLSLAIVIELSTLPQPAFEMPTINVPASGTQVLREVEAPRRSEAGSEQPNLPEANSPADLEVKPFGPRARKTITDEGRVTLQDAGSLHKTELAAPAAIAAPTEIAAEEKQLMQDRLEVDSNDALAMQATSSMISPPCAGDIRDLPESWLECIERLQNDGLVDQADSQRKQLQQAFPDFKLP
jgi:hypothetical protein